MITVLVSFGLWLLTLLLREKRKYIRGRFKNKFCRKLIFFFLISLRKLTNELLPFNFFDSLSAGATIHEYHEK